MVFTITNALIISIYPFLQILTLSQTRLLSRLCDELEPIRFCHTIIYRVHCKSRIFWVFLERIKLKEAIILNIVDASGLALRSCICIHCCSLTISSASVSPCWVETAPVCRWSAKGGHLFYYKLCFLERLRPIQIILELILLFNQRSSFTISLFS